MALPLFVRKLMAPVEVKLVLSALSEETERLGMDGRIAASIVTPKVVDNILAWTKEIKEDVHNNGKPPRAVVLYLMMDVTRDYLASGEFAIYAGFACRGMDTLSIQGRSLYGLNFYCLNELVKLGQMTEETKAAALKATTADINAFGSIGS
jgi:hypothetical protein